MKKLTFYILALIFSTINANELQAQWKTNDMLRPRPPVVTLGRDNIPSDAEILFNGRGLSQWRSKDGTEVSWGVKDSCLVVTKEWSDIRTHRNFGDCQLHLEFMISTPVKGNYNMHGNSGVVFMGKYEVQIMDSYRYETFADGQNAAIYGQCPPMVDAGLPPDKWQNFDIIFTSPRFSADGGLVSPAKITMLHNGVLVHNNVLLEGQSSWLGEFKYEKHPCKLPITLQSHIQPVHFRNIWVRDLEPEIISPYTKEAVHEITLPTATMAGYAGEYHWADPSQPVIIIDKGNYLEALLPGNATRELIAYDADKFFAKGIELWFEFKHDGTGKVSGIEMNAGGNIITFGKNKENE